MARFAWAALGLDKSKVEVTVYNSKDFSIKGIGNMSHLVDRCVRCVCWCLTHARTVCAGVTPCVRVCAGVSVHGVGVYFLCVCAHACTCDVGYRACPRMCTRT